MGHFEHEAVGPPGRQPVGLLFVPFGPRPLLPPEEGGGGGVLDMEQSRPFLTTPSTPGEVAVEKPLPAKRL